MVSATAPEMDCRIGVAETAVVPLARAALAFHLTREQALRRLMTGQLTGQRIDGRWVVDASALAIAVAERQDASRLTNRDT